jgi:3'(2'), 5'-bisphosphate nucleotidase
MYYAINGEGSFYVDEKGTSKKILPQQNYLAKQKINVVASRSHLTDEVLKFVDDLKKQDKDVDFVSSGSSLKFCLVAEGKADVYPRFGPTMEWDTAAGQAIIECAGGKVLNNETRQPLLYNKENLLNPFFMVEF